MDVARRAVPTPLFAAAALAAAVAAGTATATLRNPLIVVGLLLVAAFTAFALRSIAGAAAIFVACTFVEQLPGAGSGVTLVKGLGAIVAFAWAVALVRGTLSLRAVADGRAAVVAGAAGLVVCALASAAWATDARTAVDAGLRLAQGALLAVVLLTCLAGRRALPLGVAGFVAGATLSAVLGLAGVGGAAASPTGDATRAGGGLADPNYLAAVLVPGVFFALGLCAVARRRTARLCLLAAAVVMVAALFRTESRGGVVALGASVLTGVLVGGRLRRRVVAAAIAIVAAGAVYLAVAPSAHRLLAFGGDGSGRTELWSVSYQAFRTHPLGGVGAGNFSVVEPSYAVTSSANLTKPYQELTLREVVHNTYLHVLAELGIVGLLLLLLLVVGAVWIGLRAARSFARAGDVELETLTRGLVVGAVGMLAAFGFLTAQYEKQLWVVVGLLGAAAAVAASAGARRSAERSRAG